MHRFLICSFLLACGLGTSAQSHVGDSILALASKIARLTPEQKAICKNYDTYKVKLTAISREDAVAARRDVREADTQFLAQNKKSKCVLIAPVTYIDSSLLHISGDSNNAEIHNAIQLLSYRLSDYVLLSVQTNPHDSTTGNLQFALQSLYPAVIPAPGTDSLATRALVIAGKRYSIRFTGDKIQPAQRTVNLAKDSTMVIDLVVKPIAAPPDEKKSSWPYWALGTALLLIGTWVIARRSKQTPASSAITPDTIPAKPEENPNEKKQKTEPVLPPSSSRHFSSEIMMTAGPRKHRMNEPNADLDLGEDVCGWWMDGDRLFVWLLDGSSDYDAYRNPLTGKEYFSSRLLAQSLAGKLKTRLTAGMTDFFGQMMSGILEEVKADWLRVIRELPEEEKIKRVNDLKSGIAPQCASTVLANCLTLDGNLLVYRSGDSKLLAYGSADNGHRKVYTELAGKNAKSNDKYFFQLVLSDNGELEISHNQPRSETLQFQHIQTVIGFSDGVGLETIATLKHANDMEPELVREKLAYERQGTDDDKSLYYIEIKS